MTNKKEDEQNNIDKQNNIDEQNNIKEQNNIDKKKDKTIIGELKRVYYFYKEHIDILILILILSSIILYSSLNLKPLNNTLKRGGNRPKEISQQEIARDLLWNNIINVLFGYKILQDLKEKYPLNESKFNYVLVYIGYIFIAFFIRPFKLIFKFLIILFGVSGSFIFPFMVFGVMMYYVYKKMIKNKSPNPNDLFKENQKS